MKIAVCIKQVPMVSAMRFDAATKTIVRDGVANEVSAFDLRAMLRAVELREQHGGELVVVTMGPPQAIEALAECLALGGDRAIHLCDRAFAGSDTLATARALAAALRREQFDLILCGRHSVDAETGQVGPEVAELLDMPQITGARTLEIDPSTRTLRAERETDDGLERVEVALPALVTAAEDLAPERFTTEAEREAAKGKPIDVVDAAALNLDPAQIGVAGSPTWVLGIESAQDERRRVIFDGDVAAGVDALVTHLVDAGLFGEWRVERRAPAIVGRGGANVRAGAPILVVAEVQSGTGVRGVSFELIAKARQLADAHGGRVDVLLAAPQAAQYVGALAGSGADRILLAEHAALERSTEPHAALLADVIAFEQPGLVLLGATSFGRDVAPRVAGRMGLGLTGECIDLTVDEEGRVLQHKPAFGGSIVALIASRTSPEMATVRAGMLGAAPPAQHPLAEVVPVAVPPLHDRVRVVERVTEASEAADLEGAEVVVGFGKGIGGPQALPLIRELAELVGGALCTTRDVTDAGWVAKQFQVGMTGRAIAPRLYIAVALRGAFEHMVGTRRAGLIVGINRSRNSPLIKNSDYGLVADWNEAVPLLIEKLRTAKKITTEAQRHGDLT